jgi:hypothetical protein
MTFEARKALLVAAALPLIACGDDLRSGSPDRGSRDAGPDAAGGVACAGADARMLVEEIVHELLMDAVHSAVGTHRMERAFASQLIGVPQANIGHLTLFEECAGPSSYDPYCEYADSNEPAEDPFFDEHDRCSRLACEAEAIGLDTMYWTMRPETDPEARHPFTYETTSPAGQAIADPNPLLVWRYDLTVADAVTVSSELDRALVVTPEAGEAIDLDHRGSVRVTQVELEPTGASLDLTFPDLLAGGDVTLELTLDAQARATGSLRHGDEVIAPVSGTFAFDTPLAFDWAPCP